MKIALGLGLGLGPGLAAAGRARRTCAPPRSRGFTTRVLRRKDAHRSRDMVVLTRSSRGVRCHLPAQQSRRLTPCRFVLDRLNLRTLDQARDLTFVTMNCLDNSHDHRGHGPRRVTTQDPRARSTSMSRLTSMSPKEVDNLV